jgi:hypothetical protein
MNNAAVSDEKSVVTPNDIKPTTAAALELLRPYQISFQKDPPISSASRSCSRECLGEKWDCKQRQLPQ